MNFKMKLSETKWLKSSLLLLLMLPPSTFGFALSCNFYERPNVSKEWKTIIFMFHYRPSRSHTHSPAVKSEEAQKASDEIIRISLSRAVKCPNEMCLHKKSLLINFQVLRSFGRREKLLCRRLFAILFLSLFVQVFCCGSLRWCLLNRLSNGKEKWRLWIGSKAQTVKTWLKGCEKPL